MIHFREYQQNLSQRELQLHVLKVNFDIERGEFVSIMGASGSRKVLIEYFRHLERYDSGEYY